MIKVLFICHGNICRSPAAEFIFKEEIRKRKKENLFEVASAGVSAEEYGEPVYPPIGAFLRRMGIDYSGKRATVAAREDMTEFDYIVVMEDVHAAALKRKFPWADFGKVYKLNDFKNGKLTGQRTGADIEDPWYTENYGRVFDEILKGCRELAEYLCENAKSN